MNEGFTTGSSFLTLRSIEVVKKADRKLTFIPVVFIMLRIWGTIRFLRLMACLPDCGHVGPRPPLKWLIILQVSTKTILLTQNKFSVMPNPLKFQGFLKFVLVLSRLTLLNWRPDIYLT